MGYAAGTRLGECRPVQYLESISGFSGGKKRAFIQIDNFPAAVAMGEGRVTLIPHHAPGICGAISPKTTPRPYGQLAADSTHFRN